MDSKLNERDTLKPCDPTTGFIREDFKFFGLGMIQVIGVSTAFLLAVFSRQCLELNSKVYCILLGLVSVLLVLSFAIGFCGRYARYTLHQVKNAMKGKTYQPPEDFKQIFSLQQVIGIFTWSNFIVLAVCVYLTGGSRESFFSPFLFIIPPIIIILGSVSSRQILVYGSVAFTIFLFELFPPEILSAPQVKITSELAHNIFLAVSTFVSSVLPLLLDFMDKRDEEKKYPS